jgi:alkylresorcinol/alkylpyrone synthase
MRRGLAVADVRHWAVHPGGQKVLDSLAGALGLDERQLAVTREVLRDRGNVSSATVWFELERILRDGVLPGEYCAILAAGAGLSIHAALLQG